MLVCFCHNLHFSELFSQHRASKAKEAADHTVSAAFWSTQDEKKRNAEPPKSSSGNSAALLYSFFSQFVLVFVITAPSAPDQPNTFPVAEVTTEVTTVLKNQLLRCQ